MGLEPKDAEYPHVPTPKELELSQQLVELQQEKDQREQKLINQITDLESQVHILHVRINDLSQSLQTAKREQAHHEQQAVEAERAVWRAKVDVLQRELEQEKHDKEAQQKWQLKFVAAAQPQQQQHGTRSTESPRRLPPVDPADDVFTRFAQSIALLPASSAAKVTQAGVLPFLTHLLREDLGDLVTGSVLLALVHLAINEKPQRPPLHRHTLLAPVSPTVSPLDAGLPAAGPVNVKAEIVKAGAAAPLVHILEHATNLRVAIEAARLCAALASHIPNKRVLAAKNAVRFLTNILTPCATAATATLEDGAQAHNSARLEALPLPGDSETQRAALSALVNLSYDSEILRSQIVNFHFLPFAVRYLRESPDARVQCEAAKLLGNLACNHVVNQSVVMTCEGDAALAKCLRADILHQCPELVRASAIGIANLAHTSVNQLSIGYGGATTSLLQLAVDATSPSVLEAVLSAITCLCHQNPLNKSRVAAQNGVQVLLYVISQSKRFGHDESVLVAACECFAVVARTRASRSQVLELDGHVPICRLCKRATSDVMLEASASAVCALIPPPDERGAMLADSRESKLETNCIGLSALERARHLLAQSSSSSSRGAPSWLTSGIQTLRSYAAASSADRSSSGASAAVSLVPLEQMPDATASEFHERSYFSLESLTEIAPDELCPHFYDS